MECDVGILLCYADPLMFFFSFCFVKDVVLLNILCANGLVNEECKGIIKLEIYMMFINVIRGISWHLIMNCMYF